MKCVLLLACLCIWSAVVEGADVEEDPDAEYDESYEDEETPINNSTHVGDENDEPVQLLRSTSLEVDAINSEFHAAGVGNFTQVENATSIQKMPTVLQMLAKTIKDADSSVKMSPGVGNTTNVHKARSSVMKNPVYAWRSVTTEDPIPKCAFQVGVDKEGGAIFAGRAKQWGHSVIANVREKIKKAFVPLWSEVHEKHDFEVLCITQGEGFWKDFREKDVPRGAVIGGTETDEEKMYVGRTLYDGMYLPCKIQPLRNVCFLAHNGTEHHIYSQFEILVIR